jgi:hypothetical protein
MDAQSVGQCLLEEVKLQSALADMLTNGLRSFRTGLGRNPVVGIGQA